MKVRVNDQEITLFHGAKVKHALLKADQALYHAVFQEKAEVRDQEGHLVDLNGAVSDGWGYQVIKK